MPFDELEQDQDETAMQPWRLGYRMPDEEGSESQPSIGMRIMQMATPQAQPDAPGPLRGIDALQQAAQGDSQLEPRLSIGQRIMQIGRQGVPPFDIQDGRPVWGKDPQTQQKPSIGQRIMRGASSETQGSMPSSGYDLSSWETRPETARNAGQSKPFMPQPVQGFSLSNSSQLEHSGETYKQGELLSGPALEADKDTSEEPAAFSASASREGSAKGGGPESLRGPLDFNEFASFVGGGQQDNFTPNALNLSTSTSNHPMQPETDGRPEALGTAAEAAPGPTLVTRGKSAGKTSNVPIPPLTGSVGRGGNNDPADVKWVQQLLNAAIDDDDLAGEKIPEDGKVTDAMLKLLDQYQSTRGFTKEKVIDRKSQTLENLAQNPLFDPRWSKYDDMIKKEVAYYNDLFSKQYPEGFKPLDWRRVKAMLWVEVEGPDVRDPIDWLVWPMQIGRKKGDPGMPAIKYGRENTDRYVPAELRDKLRHQRMSAELNIRAGVAYVYDRAIQSWRNTWRITDPTERTYMLKAGDTLEGLAKRLHTTVGELLQHNGLNEQTAKLLQPTHPLKYRFAKEIPQWRDWPSASALYNATGDPDYASKVEKNYTKIKRRW